MEIVQLVNCLLHKHEKQALGYQYPHKSLYALAHICNTRVGRSRGRGITGVCWTANLVEWVNFQFQ